MKFSEVKPGELAWVAPIEGDELEVCIDPDQVSQLSDTLGLGIDSETTTLRVCQRLFVNFRGVFNDNGEPTKNTLANRMAIYRKLKYRVPINAKVWETIAERNEGESDAATD